MTMFCLACLQPIDEGYWELRWLTRSGYELSRGPYHDPEEISAPPGDLVYERVYKSFAEDRWDDEGGQ